MKYKIFFLSMILTGCTVGENYTKPESNLPQNWASSTSTESTQLQTDWWKNFNDPILDQLIGKANSNNFDLKIAEARITEARANYGLAKAELLPQVNANASANRQSNRFQFAGAPAAIKKPFNTYQAGFDASWELDLFGGKRREIESAHAEIESTEASCDDVRISLLGEVAKNYINIRKYQAQIALANDVIAADQKTVEINNKLFKAGTASKLDLIKAEAELNQTKSDIPKYENLLAQTEFAEDVLLGEQPGYSHKLVAEIKPIPIAEKEIILSAPAKIIASRPDVKVAERKLASATAQQGVALAQFFPDISLSGFVGLMNIDAADLLQKGSKSWSATSGLLWPILNYGKLSSNLDASDAREQEALAEYQKSVIQALSDVEIAVTAYQKQQEQYNAIAITVEKDSHAVEIANNRYKQGTTSFLEVLDAKRKLYSNQQQLLESQAITSQNMVASYKSLGGAWDSKK